MKNEGRGRIFRKVPYIAVGMQPLKSILMGLFLHLKHSNGMCGVAQEDNTILNYWMKVRKVDLLSTFLSVEWENVTSA